MLEITPDMLVEPQKPIQCSSCYDELNEMDQLRNEECGIEPEKWICFTCEMQNDALAKMLIHLVECGLMETIKPNFQEMIDNLDADPRN